MKNTQKGSCLCWAIVLYILVIANTAYSQVTLTPSIHHAPYNISCFGGSDGSISLAVSGGVAPFKYTWSNGATTQNISNVPAGYYSVVVQDAGTLTWDAEITLIEPRDLEVIPLAYKYPNEYNISLNGACNGMISVTVNNGVPPYTYLWRDGNTSQSRTSLCRGSYSLILTDANGCSVSTETIDLLEPERSDWTMTGNAGTNPGSQFIGTTDQADLKFKTNSQERLKISSNGSISIPSFSGGEGMLYVDSNGIISSSREIPSSPCFGPTKTVWKIIPNIIFTCPGIQIGIGTYTIPTNYALAVNGKIICEEVKVKQYANWPDFIFKKDYQLMPLKELNNFLYENEHLPNMPSENEVKTNEGYSLGEMNKKQLEKIEILYLYVIDLQKQIDELKKSKNFK